MNISWVELWGAKICTPAAIVLYFISQFFYLPERNDFIILMLIIGWLSSCRVCSAYTKLYEDKYKDM